MSPLVGPLTEPVAIRLTDFNRRPAADEPVHNHLVDLSGNNLVDLSGNQLTSES